MKYPQVLDEWATLRELQAGKSIARYGDGELKMMDGSGYIREEPNPDMAAELKQIIRRPLPNCLVGIPTMDPTGPKYASWARHKARFAMQLRRGPKHATYHSAFISRPDSAPAILTREYADEVLKLFTGKFVSVLCEKKNSVLDMLTAARPAGVYWTECLRHGAYSQINHYERALTVMRPDVVIMACGPTATCLAYRIARRGIQAIDFGSGGGFITKLLDGRLP